MTINQRPFMTFCMIVSTLYCVLWSTLTLLVTNGPLCAMSTSESVHIFILSLSHTHYRNMGRTRRRRSKKGENKSYNLDKDGEIITLKRWLVLNGWTNETSLHLKYFPDTGRGVSSTKCIFSGNSLISIPLDLMITYHKVRDRMYTFLNKLKVKLKMQELLSLFLMTESKCNDSFWRSYIDSLPEEFSNLPWLCSEDELLLYPRAFRRKCEIKLENFQESRERVKLILNSYNTKIWNDDLFKWAYVMVNTRSVYIDPSVFEVESSCDNILLDKPCMALCPFLDMFNHNSQANTQAICVKENYKYQYKLRTFTKHCKYEEIFISYGSHDNETLLIEYGFFIKGNTLDTVRFDLLEILNVLDGNLDRYKFKFIETHNITSDLYISRNDLSFNLQALLFILFSQEIKSLSVFVFSANYPEHFTNIFKESAISLLKYKIKTFQQEHKEFTASVSHKSSSFYLVENFLGYWNQFLNDLLQDYCKR